jgi:hypothetical protein
VRGEISPTFLKHHDFHEFREFRVEMRQMCGTGNSMARALIYFGCASVVDFNGS